MSRWFLPERIVRRTLVFGWLSLITEIAIVGTGGAVRLTASGLGCSTWPQCTPGSFVPTPELGIHGAIEFGNRMVSFLVAVTALIMFLLVLKLRRERPELFHLSLWLGLLVVAQAVIGGITVRSGLNSYIVGVHFVISSLLVILATMLLYFLYRNPADAVRVGPRWYRQVVGLTAVVVAITVIVGVLTTGSGPHAGDIDTPRNGFNTELMEHLHSYPAYVTLLLGVLLAAVAASMPQLRDVRRFAFGLVAVTVVQAIVGVTQSRLGLPPLLVGIHLILACTLIAAMTGTVLAVMRSATSVVPPIGVTAS